ncbi:metallophosphoesterase [Thermococcus profundus]|uniref:metallophosphoesterase n=1 Tax=Thermococcus profundus TaxID=49899 RepID=UPI0030026407
MVLLSDTHVGDKARVLPPLLLERISAEKPDLILHAGDVTDPAVLEELEKMAPTLAVRGNVDKLTLPEEKVVEVEGIRVLLLHGHQFFTLNAHFLALKALEAGADVLVFGHTHRFYSDIVSLHGRRVWLVNPGSPTFPRYDDPSFAVLGVSGEGIDVKRIVLY